MTEVVEELNLEDYNINLKVPSEPHNTQSGGIFDNYYVKPLELFYQKNGKIPNCYKLALSDDQSFIKEFKIKFKNEIQEQFELRNFNNEKNKKNMSYCEEILFIMKDGDIFRVCEDVTLYTLKGVESMESIKLMMEKFTLKYKKEPKIWMLYPTMHGIRTMPFKLNKQKLDIKLNYNDDFEEVSNQIIQNLNKNKNKGVYLFHGLPGSGKTSYLRYLVSKTNKKVIFVTPQVAAQISAPEFTDFIMNNSGCVLVIEDAENLIQSRENTNSPISSILNITDGLLSDQLKIQVICTFNTSIDKIDEALLRKGRLMAIYEFKKLSLEKTKKLINQLYPNIDYDVKEGMTLADIYNLDYNNYFIKNVKNTSVTGFGKR